MLAGQVQHHRHVRQDHAVAALHGEMHLAVDMAYINGAHLGVFAKAVAGDWARDLRNDVAHSGIVRTQNRRSIKRHAVQKVDKGGLQLAKVVTIRFHVVGVDVGDHRHHRQQVQKRGIRFVSFDHDVVAQAQLGIGARTVETTANHIGRV